jgi:outer membrane lipoprotein-sorting protein
MLRKSLAILVSTAFALSLSAAPNTPSSVPKLSAAEIVDKNVAARGGLQAWRAVQSMTMEGKMGVGGNQRATLPTPVPGKKGGQIITPQRPTEEMQLPFVMELARPRKMRLELQFNGQTAVQVYDGTNGWKLRPFLNRRDVEPFTPEEIKKASMQSELDGFLVDYAVKGTRVELDGIEQVEERDAYKLKLTLKNGDVTHVWIDAQTFLEAKVEGQPRRLDGTDHPVEVFYRDYRPVNGLQVPFVLETRVLPVAHTALGLKDTPVPVERVTILKVTVNPKLDDSSFAKPVVAPTTAAKPPVVVPPKTK